MSTDVVNKLWGFCHTLRHDGIDYGDYIVKHTEQTWEKWLQNKLLHPRVYRYERVDTRMPQFDLQEDEIQDVMVVLKGMRGRTKDNDVRGHKLTPMEAAREKGREKAIAFVGVDGLPHEGAKYVQEGVLGVTFEYPLCVDKAVEVGLRILREPGFRPEKTYLMNSRIITRP